MHTPMTDAALKRILDEDLRTAQAWKRRMARLRNFVALGVVLMLIVTATLLASCKDNGPKGLDPIVFANNAQSTYSPVSITWYDQSGQVQQTLFAPFQQQCIHFTSTTIADSVRFEVKIGDPNDPTGQRVYSSQTSPWFNPLTGLPTASPGEYPDGAEYWTMTVTQDGGAILKAVRTAPC